MSLKNTCDHCDQIDVGEHDDDLKSRWCQRCTREDWKLVDQLGLIDDAGFIMSFTQDSDKFNFSMPGNVAKMKTLPKRGQPGTAAHQPSVPATTSEPVAAPDQTQQAFNDAWFQHYNSLAALPIIRHG